jgi:hypothetical protein
VLLLSAVPIALRRFGGTGFTDDLGVRGFQFEPDVKHQDLHRASNTLAQATPVGPEPMTFPFAAKSFSAWKQSGAGIQAHLT